MSADPAVFTGRVDNEGRIPVGFCQCGCGEKTELARTNWKRMGYVKGQPFRFLPSHSRRVKRAPTVYQRRRVVGSKHGSVLEHVLIAERALGKPLPYGVQVHHFDENRRNNSNSNLVICQDQAYHLLLHVRARVFRAGGNPNTELVCSTCKAVKPIAEFNKQSANQAKGRTCLCRQCQADYWQAYHRARKVAAS